MIPFLVADRPVSLRIIKGMNLNRYSGKVGIMSHANTTKNFQELFKNYPCGDKDFCDVIGKKCTRKRGICKQGKILRERTVKACDSGVFTKNGCMWSYEELFEIYENMDAKYGIMIDYLKDKDKTLESAKEAIDIYNSGKYNFKLIGVAQGESINEYMECYGKLKSIGFKQIAVGGLLMKHENTARYVRVKDENFLFKVLRTIRANYPKDWLFALGCYHKKRRNKFRDLNVFGSDFKGWIFHYKKEGSLSKADAQKERFKQIRSYIGENVFNNHNLLVLGCSDRKLTDAMPLLAKKRYDGFNYRVIKKLQREGKFPEDLDIGIISAKYGFLTPDMPIEHYNQKMTKERAFELQSSVSSELNEFLQNNGYSEIFINLGKEYRLALNGFYESVQKNTKIIDAKGGIGQKASQMKKWILDLN